MTREDAKRAAEVMLAYANGEEIEIAVRTNICEPKWCTVDSNCHFGCHFDWGTHIYRVKPKEKFNPKTLQPFLRVLVRNLNETKWLCDYYSYTEENLFVCTSNIKWIYCIPYNNETKYLIGTDKEAPEYYRYWED